MTVGILPRRFSPGTKLEDIGASRMQAWLETTQKNDANIRLLQDLVNRLMQRRTEEAAAAVPGAQVKWAKVAHNSWIEYLGGDVLIGTFWDGGVWNGDTIAIAKPYDLRRTPFDGKEPGDGYTYEYDPNTSSKRLSISVADPADIETQIVTPSYYAGQVIPIIKTDPLVPEDVRGDVTVEWQELTVRAWAKEL